MTAATQPDPSAPREELLGLVPAAARTAVARMLEAAGEPSYRLDQVLSWLYERRARSFDEMTNLPLGLREALARTFSLSPLEASFEARSADGTIKHLWRLADGQEVESVLIPTPGRVTLCLSSQAGCALGCTFCATGDFGFRRQLSPAEIVAQFRNADRVATEAYGRGIGNVVYMGMGEPFANQEAVFDSLTILHEGFGLGARRITVSTVGVVPGIRALAARPEPFRLAVSLHAPTHEMRRRLVPIEQRWPIPELFDAIDEYQAAKGRRVSFEYTLIEGLNDAPETAQLLAELIGDRLAFVNLIPWNPIPGRDWAPSGDAAIARFLEVLQASGLPAAVRTPRGRDIAAACGQLRLERELEGSTT
ncbi:MAG: 23S rRNA (adenine(2503)-C(2))-methyltransferase RlmN [Gemmatimonadales bacterium]|jgi:23S rRNA (adenine2503-C2)-methyltransferase